MTQQEEIQELQEELKVCKGQLEEPLGSAR